MSFDSRGGSQVTRQKVKDQESAKEPDIPSRPGYIFLGWFTDPKATKAYDFNLPVTANLTLYAGWRKVTPPTPTHTHSPTKTEPKTSNETSQVKLSDGGSEKSAELPHVGENKFQNYGILALGLSFILFSSRLLYRKVRKN